KRRGLPDRVAGSGLVGLFFEKLLVRLERAREIFPPLEVRPHPVVGLGFLREVPKSGRELLPSGVVPLLVFGDSPERAMPLERVALSDLRRLFLRLRQRASHEHWRSQVELDQPETRLEVGGVERARLLELPPDLAGKRRLLKHA